MFIFVRAMRRKRLKNVLLPPPIQSLQFLITFTWFIIRRVMKSKVVIGFKLTLTLFMKTMLLERRRKYASGSLPAYPLQLVRHHTSHNY